MNSKKAPVRFRDLARRLSQVDYRNQYQLNIAQVTTVLSHLKKLLKQHPVRTLRILLK